MDNNSDWGGLSVLVSGDFFQLPPVRSNKRQIIYHRAFMTPEDLEHLSDECESSDDDNDHVRSCVERNVTATHFQSLHLAPSISAQETTSPTTNPGGTQKT